MAKQRPSRAKSKAVTAIGKGWLDADKDQNKIEFNKVSAITSESDLLLLRQDGTDHNLVGKAVRYDVDVSARHIDKKKGDIVFTDVNNMPVKAVRGFYPTKDIQPSEKVTTPPKEAEASH